MFQITRTSDNLEIEVLQYFDNYKEARAYVLKLGDQSILATINVKSQEENPIYA